MSIGDSSRTGAAAAPTLGVLDASNVSFGQFR
jgi:hypothetical protein